MAERYSVTAIVLHWLIGVALIVEIIFGYLLRNVPRGIPARAFYVNLHKATGLALGVLIVLRLLWLWGHRGPPLPESVSPPEAQAAHATHRLLYGCMVVSPLSGYIASNFSRFGVHFLGLKMPPWGPDLPAVYAVFNGIHRYTGYVFAALIVFHVAGALKHLLVDRDEVFARMWPARSP
jgi:cytochrome b561